LRGSQLFIERFRDAWKSVDSGSEFLNGKVDCLKPYQLL